MPPEPCYVALLMLSKRLATSHCQPPNPLRYIEQLILIQPFYRLHTSDVELVHAELFIGGHGPLED